MRRAYGEPIGGLLTALAAGGLALSGCTPAVAPANSTPPSAPRQAEPAPAAAAPAAAPAAGGAASVGGAAPSTAAAAAPAPLQPPVKVRHAMQYVMTDAPVFLALERGYFAEEGLELETSRAQAAGDVIPLLATGQLDATSGSAAAALYNAVARGADVRMVMDSGSTLPGFPLYSLAVRKDLVDSGQVRDWADLKGLRFANTGNGNGLHRGIDVALNKGGGSMADVEITLMAPVDMMAAFGNRALDAAPLFEPFGAQGEEQGVLVRWRRSDEIFTRLQGGLILLSPAFIQQQPEAARRFVLVYLRGIRDYNDAFLKGRDRAGLNAAIARGVGLRDTAILDKVYPVGLDPDGRIDVETLRDNQDWFQAHGFVTTPVDINRVVDHSFVDYALGRLGRYQP